MLGAPDQFLVPVVHLVWVGEECGSGGVAPQEAATRAGDSDLSVVLSPETTPPPPRQRPLMRPAGPIYWKTKVTLKSRR